MSILKNTEKKTRKFTSFGYDVPMNYTITRSRRKSIAIKIEKDGTVSVKAPLFVPKILIENFIEKKRHWINEKKCQIVPRKTYTEGEIHMMRKKLGEYLSVRVREIWEMHNLPPYTSLKVTKSESRWGSCSAKNRLCFSHMLAEYLDTKKEFIDAIIVHELAHLREKNHQKPFWDLVYSIMPDYETVVKSIRKNG